ncbi:efflux RND transporter permease subunit [Aureibacter tunicatorum]|uniref:HAE1 family hydrophobic/amphiphilic exporter-1 n=1 Tax=Aureibacter tunicatorum TaxID=866807 RepID=A0AAE4BU93_9BACT|nr:efflux RND transporter permease subunit [Aureibacter tunicatorum]MDR6240805.1 HAE1 family hydrophobic/amphiphilic exporter-1 [Aureibacter tunicatorum]BDD06862.1 multidrug transporter AcrB [Aureibacter tunicatorum]
MFKIFIERPVLSTVISILIALMGILAMRTLPMTMYPEIAPPTVSVRTSFPGANAETLVESVITPIEEQINGVEGMTYMTSKASNDGSVEITVFFKSGYDPDMAAVNVQNRVALASPVLPAEVNRMGVTTEKRENSALMYVSVYSENSELNDVFIQNYVNINIRPELLRIDGVGSVQIFGDKGYSMRIWIDPVKMANYGITTGDITAAINEQSVEASAGTLGQNAGQSFEYVIKYKGRYREVEEYESIILRRLDNGQLLQLKDVATIELDAYSYVSNSVSKGMPTITFGVYQTPGTNSHEIAQLLYDKFDEMEKTLPEGLAIKPVYDTDKFLTASMDKVKSTIVEAFILVFIVVFIFLQDFKSTVIPAIAVPVAIVGSFFFLQTFGFSINLLTLFALILAIGIVVDDAIIVVEAVHAKLEKGYTNVKEATNTAMNEIGGPIVSVTLVMGAVFVPITFAEGPIGVFYKQFGVTLIIAVLISAVNALTLSPALCALFLKPNHNEGEEKKGYMNRFFTAFNIAFEMLTNKYVRSVGFMLKRKWIGVGILMTAIATIFVINQRMSTGFVPEEDEGFIFLNIELPEGASLDRTQSVTKQLSGIMNQIEGIDFYTFVNGSNFFSGSGSAYAMGFAVLDPWDERKEPHLSLEAVMGQVYGAVSQISDAQIICFAPGGVPGFGQTNGVEAQLMDKVSGKLVDLDRVSEEFTGALFQRPEIAFVASSFNTNFPQYEMTLDVPKIKEAALSVDEVMSAMQGFIGGIYAADFNRYGKQFKVFVQAKPENRDDPESLERIFVRNVDGVMAPVSEFVTLKRTNGPQTVSRYNLFNTVTLNATANPGYSSGDAIKAFNEEAAKHLPENYQVDYTGLTREEIAAGNQMVFIFLLSLLFTYFFLAIQYESYILPFAVVLSLPLGIAGAYLTSWLLGLENNIYFQVALIMLLGLLSKNAILIIEFALQRRNEGLSLIDAAKEGAKARLRPVLMTAFSFILGLMPLVLAQGVAAASNRSIGSGAAGGMLIGTAIGLFVIPVFFVIFQGLQERLSGKKKVQEVEVEVES